MIFSEMRSVGTLRWRHVAGVAAVFVATALAVGACLRAAEATAVHSIRETPVVLAVRAARDAVVNISTERIVQRSYLFGDDVFDRLFMHTPLRRTAKETSLGSGVVIDDQNHILTNAHVVRKASRISVKASNGDVYEAQLVGWDVKSDIAVLKIKGAVPLPHAQIGTAKDLMIGETIIAIGNPYGYSQTVTTGVVSALHRDVDIGSDKARSEALYDVIQTDAAINPGNSGGPLINLTGRVVGINTAILNAAEGMGFAIPIDRAVRVVEDLLSYGEVHLPWLGISTETMQLLKIRSVSAGDGPVTAVVATFVFSKGPANGLIQMGDHIERIGSAGVSSEREFRARLKDYKATDSIPLTISRNGASLEVRVPARPFPLKLAQQLCYEWLGFWVEETALSKGLLGAPGRASVGVKKLRSGGPAERAGLRIGDVLTQINDRPITTLAHFQVAMKAATGRGGIYVELRRGALYLRGTIP